MTDYAQDELVEAGTGSPERSPVPTGNPAPSRPHLAG
jgi:hypothetical protein